MAWCLSLGALKSSVRVFLLSRLPPLIGCPHHVFPCSTAANHADPVFVRLLRVPFHFEERQRLIARVYDIDSVSGTDSAAVVLERQDFIGEVSCFLADIMGSRGCTFRAAITNTAAPARAKGTLTIRGEEVRNANALVTLELSAESLDKKVRVLTGVHGVYVFR
jgi:hypothetical protein